MTDDDRAILSLERRWWKLAGNKEATISRELGMTPTRYYRRLNLLLDDPAALAFDAPLVRRLQRIRSARADRRRSLGVDHAV